VRETALRLSRKKDGEEEEPEEEVRAAMEYARLCTHTQMIAHPPSPCVVWYVEKAAESVLRSGYEKYEGCN
jgi:hypothetical protein